MDNRDGPGNGLLDRLKALGDGSESAVPRRSVQPPKTPTKEDTLIARLRILRNDAESPSEARPGLSEDENSRRASKPEPIPSVSPRGKTEANPSARGELVTNVDDVDGLLVTDDRTLEELLEDEGDDPGFDHQWTLEPNTELDRISDLLQRLQKSGEHANESRGYVDSDDSDGQEMTRDVENIVSRALDEARLESSRGRGDLHEASEVPDPRSPETDKAEFEGAGVAAGEGTLALPSVPTDLLESGSPADIQPANSRKPTDFEADMDARMAALRGDAAADTFTLPSVPTLQPSEPQVKRLAAKTGYTDDDVKTWCLVCLEDATLRCLGCDNDVYCTRCWREMHVGPAAAFDQRSHKAVQFVREAKKGKLAVGA